eukprot:TRINITY_DN931_c0_g1_i1.p1 TRINITY_DN931_c0_g1~~TRINITY_DN931_c0_g1_i1.p1  ORF type:complete len:337 (+),score=41.55 TRINITY_DN931_c0_g1_i1:141-1151(+)
MEDSEEVNLDWIEIFLNFFGGICLFLFGLRTMSAELRQVAGDKLKDILTSLSGDRFRALLSGIILSGLTQSSSIVLVMLVSFVPSYMTFEQSIGVILGSGIGSTLMPQLAALNVTKYCLGFVVLGFLLSYKQSYCHIGMTIFSLGLTFFGMEVMADAMKPVQSYEPFIEFVASASSPIYCVLVGIVVTVVTNSSSATIAILMTLGGSGVVRLRESVCVVIGANIGTCSTALFASVGRSSESLKVALAQLIIKLIGGIGCMFVLEGFCFLVMRSSGTTDPDDPIDLPHRIANSHTIFNVVSAVLLLPLCSQIAGLSSLLVSRSSFHLDSTESKTEKV